MWVGHPAVDVQTFAHAHLHKHTHPHECVFAWFGSTHTCTFENISLYIIHICEISIEDQNGFSVILEFIIFSKNFFEIVCAINKRIAKEAEESNHACHAACHGYGWRVAGGPKPYAAISRKRNGSRNHRILPKAKYQATLLHRGSPQRAATGSAYGARL